MKISDKKAYISILILLILLIGFIYFRASNPKTGDAPQNQITQSLGTSTPAKVFNITTVNFLFTPNEIRVMKGDRVKIVLTNTEGTHDLFIDEFNVRSPRISGNESIAIEFVADKAGTFEFYCSVGNHRQMGMRGNLTVE